MKQDREEVIALLKSDINALVEYINSIPHGIFKEDRFEYVLINHCQKRKREVLLTLVINSLESDMKADVCKDCLVNKDK
jgi:hypothetical protein